MGIRETVTAIYEEMQDREVPPSRARELLIQLTGLSGSCLEQIRTTEAAYNAKLLACLDGDEPANKATIRAKASAEHVDFREAQHYHALVTEMIRSLKIVIRSLSDEMSLSR